MASELKSLLNEVTNLACGGLGVTIGYNAAGFVCDFVNDTPNQNKITIAFLCLGGLIGYKAKYFFKKDQRSFAKRTKRAIARNKTLAELVKDDDFLDRQGIKKGSFSIPRRVLQYALTVPLGGALGYFPGVIGITPLCYYFGDKYDWNIYSQPLVGAVAGSILGAWSFCEATTKRKYGKLYNVIGTLAGVNLIYFAAINMNFQIDTGLKLWEVLGLESAGAIVGGVTANETYKYLKRRQLF